MKGHYEIPIFHSELSYITTIRNTVGYKPLVGILNLIGARWKATLRVIFATEHLASSSELHVDAD